MKIPKKIKILAFDWTVVQDQNVSNEGNAFGSTHTKNQKIFIEPTETRQKQEHTFIHEILHALWWQMGLNQRYKDQKNLEEEIVDTLSNGLYQVIKDNNLLK